MYLSALATQVELRTRNDIEEDPVTQRKNSPFVRRARTLAQCCRDAVFGDLCTVFVQVINRFIHSLCRRRSVAEKAIPLLLGDFFGVIERYSQKSRVLPERGFVCADLWITLGKAGRMANHF